MLRRQEAVLISRKL